VSEGEVVPTRSPGLGDEKGDGLRRPASQLLRPGSASATQQITLHFRNAATEA
jgi:hypothetical protein